MSFPNAKKTPETDSSPQLQTVMEEIFREFLQHADVPEAFKRAAKLEDVLKNSRLAELLRDRAMHQWRELWQDAFEQQFVNFLFGVPATEHSDQDDPPKSKVTPIRADTSGNEGPWDMIGMGREDWQPEDRRQTAPEDFRPKVEWWDGRNKSVEERNEMIFRLHNEYDIELPEALFNDARLVWIIRGEVTDVKHRLPRATRTDFGGYIDDGPTIGMRQHVDRVIVVLNILLRDYYQLKSRPNFPFGELRKEALQVMQTEDTDLETIANERDRQRADSKRRSNERYGRNNK